MADNYAGFAEVDDAFTDSIRITAEYRGMQCGVKYAEGFVRANDAYKVRPGCLLP